MKTASLTDSEIDEIHGHLCWRKWNVVEGPLNTHRIDDPGEGFDEFVFGLPTRPIERMKDLRDLYRLMEGYVTAADRRRAEVHEQRRTKKKVEPTPAPMLADMLGARMYGHRNARLILFRLETWEMVTKGTRRAGAWAWDAKPTWKRATKERSKRANDGLIEDLRQRFA